MGGLLTGNAEDGAKEIILATSASVDGQKTAHCLSGKPAGAGGGVGTCRPGTGPKPTNP